MKFCVHDINIPIFLYRSNESCIFISQNRKNFAFCFVYRLFLRTNCGSGLKRYISALINHIRTFLGKEKLVEFVCYTFMAFRLADCCVYA